METTAERITEILNQICEKFGITMDANIVSLSELAQSLVNEIVLHNLIRNSLSLLVMSIIFIICLREYKERNEQDTFIDRIKNILEYYLPEYCENTRKNSILQKKIDKSNMFRLREYLVDTLIMFGIIFLLFHLGILAFEVVINIIKCFVSPNMLVVDYFMQYYLN